MIGKQTLREHLTAWVDRAIDGQDGALRAYLRDGDTPPSASSLERYYLATVSGSGAAVGGAASVPGVGTGLSGRLGTPARRPA